MTETSALTIRTATPADLAAAGEITVAAYRAGGFLDNDGDYADELADAAARAATADLLVAVESAGGGTAGIERVVGTATLLLDPSSPLAELAGPGEAELRMLAVDPARQRTGAGRALLGECIDRARGAGCRRFVLSSRPDMSAAHRLYERAGFRREPALDWEPVPGFVLIAFACELAPA